MASAGPVNSPATCSATVSAMPLAISGRQLDKLGDRLASLEPIADND
jgi:hypothetical protein